MWQNFVLAKKIIKEKYVVCSIILLFVLLSIFNLRNFTLIDYDEGVFALQGQWIATTGVQGKPFNFETPPLFQIFVAILIRLFQINVLALPLLSLTFSCITIYLIYHLVQKVYSPQEGLYSIIFFVTTEYFLFFSKSGLSDATFLCFFVAALLFFMRGLQSNTTFHFLLAGLFATLALYTKYSACAILIMFFIIGVLHRKVINKKWFLLSIVAPALIFVPYIYLFIRFVRIPQIGTRHVGLLGINHLKFLFYLLMFAPVPFVFTIIYTVLNFKKLKVWDVYFVTFIGVFLLFLGFYYPYFRLAYAIVPLLSITASRFVCQAGRYKTYIITTSVLFSLLMSMGTLIYRNEVPQKIGQLANYYAMKEDINYVFIISPPNIYNYIDGTILVPANHRWFDIGKKFPVILQRKKIIYPDNNELLSERKILLVHTTTFDSIKQENLALYRRGKLLTRIEFNDAPVYNKDIYNQYRYKKQFYELYLLENRKLKEKINDLWNLSFNPKVTVMMRE